MKEFIRSMCSMDGDISSKRIYSGLLVVAGIVLAFTKGTEGNVQTLIYAGVALLGVGGFAETMMAKVNNDIAKEKDGK